LTRSWIELSESQTLIQLQSSRERSLLQQILNDYLRDYSIIGFGHIEEGSQEEFVSVRRLNESMMGEDI